jgi:hypothetical protein
MRQREVQPHRTAEQNGPTTEDKAVRLPLGIVGRVDLILSVRMESAGVSGCSMGAVCVDMGMLTPLRDGLEDDEGIDHARNKASGNEQKKQVAEGPR